MYPWLALNSQALGLHVCDTLTNRHIFDSHCYPASSFTLHIIWFLCMSPYLSSQLITCMKSNIMIHSLWHFLNTQKAVASKYESTAFQLTDLASLFALSLELGMGYFNKRLRKSGWFLISQSFKKKPAEFLLPRMTLIYLYLIVSLWIWLYHVPATIS